MSALPTPLPDRPRNNARFVLKRFYRPRSARAVFARIDRQRRALARSEAADAAAMVVVATNLPPSVSVICKELAILRAFLFEDIRSIIEDDDTEEKPAR